MFSASIVDAAVQSCGCKVSGARCGGNPQTRWWKPEVRDAVKLKKESEESVRGEGSLGVPAQAAAPATRPRISGRKWMDGWMDAACGSTRK